MNSFIVTYDLKKSNYDDRSDDYKNLYKKLESYYNYARITESSWIIKGNYTSVSIRNEIMSILRTGDSLFVAKLTGEAAWSSCIDTHEKIKNAL